MWILVEYFLYPISILAYLFWFLPVHLYGHLRRRKICARVQDENLQIPAKVLREKIATQEISCVEIVKSYIKRINEINPSINAIVENRFERALEDAVNLDTIVKTSGLTPEGLLNQYPLLGVPITVKESIPVKDMSNTAGCYNAKGRRAKKDATTVERCRNAGAIVLAVTNTPELCMNWETFNCLTGCTKNPHDLRTIAGGSSGGEAALIGAAGSVVGIGSDMAGSLRLPASFCGIFSHKPSAHAVSTEGHYPDCPHFEKWNSHFSLGPMARYVCDLKLMMNVLVNPESVQLLNLQSEPVDVSKLKIFYLKKFPSILCSRPDRSIIQAMDSLLDQLGNEYQMDVKKIDPKIFKGSMHCFIMTLLEITDVDDVFAEKSKQNLFLVILKKLIGMTKISLSALIYLFVHKMAHALPDDTFAKANADLDDRKRQLETLLGDDGVLLMPTSHNVYYFHGTILPCALNTLTTLSFNALGLPVTNCPLGRDPKGRPFGIQVIGRRNNDRLTLRVAEVIEKICGGWKMPTMKT